MPRYTCTEDGSAKFWEISAEGSSVTVTFGRIGTAGQTKTKTHPSPAAAEADVAKLIREKTRKGYVLADEGAPPAAAEGSAAEAPKKAPAKKASSKKAPKEAAEPALPACGALEEKALRRLAQKLAKDPLADIYKAGKIVRDAHGGEWINPKPTLWHLVTHGLLAAEAMPGVLQELDEGPEGASPETIFAMFTRMGPHLETIGKDWSAFAPGVPSFVDRILVNAWYRDNALFEDRKGELDPRLQLALASVRRRFERPIDPADAEAMIDHLAKQLATGHMTGNSSFWMSKDGESIEHRLYGEEGLLTVVDRFGSREAFCERLVVHALEADPPEVRNMCLTLRSADLSDAAEIFALCFSWGDSAGCGRELSFFEARDDTPEALFAAAEGLVPGKKHGRYDSDDPDDPARQRMAVRDNLLALGAVRFAALGKAIPNTFEALYRFEALSDIYYPTIPRHFAAFRALPRERAIALCDGLLAKEYGYGAAAVILAAHPDEARLAELVSRDRERGGVGARYWGLHGAGVFSSLAADLEALPNDRQRGRYEALLWCLAKAAEQGASVDAAWASHLRWDKNGAEPLKYWSGSTEGALRDQALDAFSPETRRAVLLRAATEEAYPARLLGSRHVKADDRPLLDAIVDEVVRREGARVSRQELTDGHKALGAALTEALCGSVGRNEVDAAFLDLLRGALPHVDHEKVRAAVSGSVESIRDLFLRKAAAAPGDKTRVHLLDRDGDDGFTAREGSFSRIGGSVPGLAESDYPRYDDEPMTPLLTLDLDELPELAEKHPGARLLVLFHPDPEGGENQEDARLVPVARDAVHEAGSGDKLAITPVDLPIALFADDDDDDERPEDPVLKELRRQVLKRGGQVGGGPFWIQSPEDDSRGFLFELRDGLCDLNLGDVGSFYAYEGQAFYFQCH